LFTVSVTYTYYYIQRDGENKIRQTRMEKQLLSSRLEALRAQLHPHFLFNTLNSVSALVELDGQKAKNMIADLSGLLRTMLDQKDTHLISLQKELALVEQYTAIEKIRFSDHLNITLEVQEGLEGALVPAMLLQPLIENSIRHGFSEQHDFIQVDIQIFQQGQRLSILVRDDGRGIGTARLENLLEEGVGLKNTYDRLSTLFNAQFVFSLENLPKGVVNRIEIPLNFRASELPDS
ncbi:MAG: histidine kinase, partial [Phaeodactylibacter sp.]|nr:histidine kinase [Phaeodactylibacter sp.]